MFSWSTHTMNVVIMSQAWTKDEYSIGHFRVPKTLAFKARLSAKPFSLVKWVLPARELKNHFHIKGWSTYPRFWSRGPNFVCMFYISGFALSLALKQRLRATQKWPVCHWGCAKDWVGAAAPSSKTVTFKMRLGAQFLWGKWVLFAWEWKNHFHIKGWAPTLVLKQRPGAYYTMKHGTELGTYFDPVSYAIFDNSKWKKRWRSR